jgi:hypothetical protein
VVLDCTEGRAYNRIDRNTLGFTSDSKRLVYAGETDPGWMVVTNGREAGPYSLDYRAPIIFSPDRSRIAYWASRLDGKEMVVCDGVEGEAYDRIDMTSFRFSPDSRHVAYGASVARRRNGVDGFPVGPRAALHDRRPAMPHSGGGDSLLVIDGVTVPTATWGLLPRSFVFSPDSRHFACIAQSTGPNRCILVDGVKSDEFRHFGDGNDLAFQSPTVLRALSYRGGAPSWIEITISGGTR